MAGTRMRVTVIIPCYNVEAYVHDCVRSALDQTYDELEVIAVDDGSTDETGVCLDAMAAEDDRLRVVRQDNRGLGAARNVGIDLATGEALFFLDGDDALPPSALEHLVVAIEESASELAVGRIDVWRSGERWRASQQRTVYDTDRRRCSVSTQTDLLYDSMACAKLFRRSLWDRLGLRFPEGVRFEDVEIVTRAYIGARGIDVVSAVSYLWRRRTSGAASITQTVDPGSVLDRFDALTAAARVVGATGDEGLIEAHARKSIDSDLRAAVRSGVAGGPPVMEAVVDGASLLLAALPRNHVEHSTPMMRAVCESIARGDFRALRLAEQCWDGRGRSRGARITAVIRLGVIRPRLFAEVARSVMVRSLTR